MTKSPGAGYNTSEHGWADHQGEVQSALIMAGVELGLLALLIGAPALISVQRRRQSPPGTLFSAASGIAWRDLARYGAFRPGPPEHSPFRRPVHTHSGRVALTPDSLTFRPDAYSRRHGGRSLVIPVAAVDWVEALPRMFGMSCLAVFGLRDATTLQVVTRGRAARLRQALGRAGVPVRS